jgi:hypothetical protein
MIVDANVVAIMDATLKLAALQFTMLQFATVHDTTTRSIAVCNIVAHNATTLLCSDGSARNATTMEAL